MSASARVKILSSKSRKEESEEEDYDSEEERYQRNQQRLLKKVEESASAIRALSKITRPFITGTWRLEREEQRQQDECFSETVVNVPSLSKENKPHTSTSKKTSESLSDGTDNTDKADGSRKKSVWLPVKHVIATDVSAILAMEKTPTWKPLRKSKARLSLANFNMENACESPSNDVLSADSKPLSECVTKPDCTVQPKQSTKVSEELRTPLRAVPGLNQGLERRRSLSFTTECNSPVRRSSHTESEANCEAVCNSEVQLLGKMRLSQSVQTELSESSDKLSNVERQAENINNEKVDGSLSRTSSLIEEDEEYPLRTPRRSFLKSHKSPVRCSPILLKAFGEEYSVVRGSIVSPEKVVNLEECKSPKDPSKVLKGVNAYVEVRRGEDDRTGGFRWKLKELGATVSDTLNKKVTHVVFQEGLLSTFRKAKQLGAHLVSTHWVMACDESFTKVEEARYPVEKLSEYELADPLQKYIKRPKIMSPDLGSGRDEKVLSRRLQRRSIKCNSPLSLAPKSPAKPFLIKTPSPLKTKFHSKKTSPKSSPKKDNPDSDDDWDGFLAMVEAQVREKAASKRKAGEINETPTDFETRLQQLLGRGEEQTQGKREANLPLASIFHKGKVANQTDKTVTKTTKRVKSPSLGNSSASSLVMMNWLHKRSPESGQGCGKQDLSSSTAAAAASAAADEILQSMLKKTGVKSDSVKKIGTPQKGTSRASEMSSTNKSMSTTSNRNEHLFKHSNRNTLGFTVSKSVSQPNKQPVKRNKLDFQGSAACSGAMRNWLSGVKSPPQLVNILPEKGTNVSHSGSPKKLNNHARKRKADPAEVDETSDNNVKLKCNSPSKRHCSYLSPKKNELFLKNHKMPTKSITDLIFSKSDEGLRTPTKVNGSATSCVKKSSSDLTPRRRSLRLTPNKCTSLPSSITMLETVEEDAVARLQEIKLFAANETCSSKMSSKKTPIKSRVTSGKTSMSSHSSKSQKSYG
ncbi:Microcephalin [Frankliniella fusca]|uniref:Microcephalin n=1 Tax=Frankliniella fusca TaxID=407009 RepID=A0AAE1HQX5_9NEOP|nr:Microcephalin [Frankliniella fusca]